MRYFAVATGTDQASARHLGKGGTAGGATARIPDSRRRHHALGSRRGVEHPGRNTPRARDEPPGIYQR
jgi:hypothetical protein